MKEKVMGLFFLTLWCINGLAVTSPKIHHKISYWKNQLGSTLKLIYEKNGNLSGSFTTAVGCDKNRPQSVTGTYDGNAIAFMVNFRGCKTITAWVGHINHQDNRITALWYLSDGRKDNWSSTLAGYGIFIRTDKSKSHTSSHPKP